MRRLDSYLSRRAQTMFPKALVFCEEGGPVEVWSLEWAGQPTISIGRNFRDAKNGVDALVAAEKAKGIAPAPVNDCPTCKAPDYAQSITFERSRDWSGGTFWGLCSNCGHRWTREIRKEAQS